LFRKEIKRNKGVDIQKSSSYAATVIPGITPMRFPGNNLLFDRVNNSFVEVPND